jgi:hypothetical protein
VVSNRQLLVVDATPGASFKDFKLKSGAANPGPVGPVGPVLPGESGDDLVRLSGEVHILIATPGRLLDLAHEAPVDGRGGLAPWPSCTVEIILWGWVKTYYYHIGGTNIH